MKAYSLVIDYDTVRDYYLAGLWSAADVQKAAAKGYISDAQARQIIGTE